jgi:S-adenosylmethionine synthetase
VRDTDKIADQISDALIDNFLAFDANSKVACVKLVTTGQVILGEVKSNTYLDVQQIARDVIKKIGYTKVPICLKPILAAYCYSRTISRYKSGVDRANPEDQGAGDQGMMFGYTNETENYMPLALDLSINYYKN